ncbi:2814_t:CDS:2 [Gigaspora margarita]|uniref:2814_t:CDS:1 n=1 Tax=Gigaspora margarita TaxID=4874 RepID=A0ABN7U9R3_GIGMA|nr:2814_t:CDS:2 [Gigaspora margarita]
MFAAHEQEETQIIDVNPDGTFKKSKSTAHKVLEVESLGVNIKDFTTAEKLIKWLEDLKTKENKFPRA